MSITMKEERPQRRKRTEMELMNKPSRAKTVEKAAFWCFRVSTYFILACASAIFLDIFIKGSQAVFTVSFPFVNIEFLTESPQTLHVFEYEGTSYEMGDSDFRAFKEQEGAEIASKTFAYSGGGIWPCIVGTVLLVVGAMAIALTLGVLSAIFLSEYSRPGRVLNGIRLSILNLAGVPSIVFGIFGLGMFVLYFDWNVSLIAGWFTLAFMVLPIVISASAESLRSIPQALREGSLAFGAGAVVAVETPGPAHPAARADAELERAPGGLLVHQATLHL